MKSNKENIVVCPINEIPEKLSSDYPEIKPLIDHLASNKNIGHTLTFEKGTVTQLHQLDCCKQNIGPHGAKLLSESLKYNTTIKTILLGTGGISNEGAESVGQLLTTNNTIETVYLGCNLIEGDGVKALTEGLIKNKGVKSLWFKRNPIGSIGIKALIKLFETNRNIRTLDLVNTGFDLEDLTALVNALVDNNYPLERLYLSGNHLKPTACKVITKLFLNPNIKELYLSVNQLEDEGMSDLSEMLSKNNTLQHLSLASNGITDKGLTKILKAVSNNPNFHSLDLGHLPSTKILGSVPNNIGDKGAKLIADFLINNNTIKTLNIRKNKIGVLGLWKIQEALKENTSLTELKYTSIRNKKVKEAINQLIERNTTNGTVLKIAPEITAIKSIYR